MKNKKVFWVVLLIISFVLITLSLYNISKRPIQTQEYPVFFKVGDRIGFDIRPDLLSYGMIVPGGSAVRDILVSNTYNFNVTLNVYSDDLISGVVEIPREDYLIKSGANESIPIIIRVPDNMKYGNYSGKIYLMFYGA